MKIISLHHRADAEKTAALEALAAQGHDIDGLAPSRFSFVTSMRLRRALERGGYDAVLCYKPEDAMAAISAREIARGQRPSVVCWIFPNSHAPKGIAASVREGVDEWWFATDRLRGLFPKGLKGVKTAMPQGPRFDLPPAPAGPLRALWCGPIDGNGDRLIAAIEAIDRAPEGAALVICATGKAREAMRAVRYARGIVHPKRVIWRGADYDLAAEAAQATAIVQSGLDPTPVELALSRKLIFNF